MTRPNNLLRKVRDSEDGETDPPRPDTNPDLDRSFQFKAKARLNVFNLVLTASTFFVVPLMVYVGAVYLPIEIPPLHGMSGRLVFAIRCQGVAIIPFAMGILYLLIGRLRCKEAKDLENTEHYVRHSLEQYIMLLVNTVVMATFITEEYIKMIPVFIGIWVIGRFVYWFSYYLRPMYRGFALCIGMLPNLGMMAYNLFAMVDSGFTSDVSLFD
ncbi:transmembrane protein 79-like [Patiria miniata]|uniref:Transmembrane protein 79 n=1 Tax=Patiria miniata TaxID=46514 RepID=A0A914BCZ9_PATMI|nr:transmembrane protein 79-like [Patiria miniata]